MKGIGISMAVAVGLLVTFSGQATAAGETALIGSKVSPIASGLYKTVPKPAGIELSAEIVPPPDATSTRVMEEISIDLPETVRAQTLPFTCAADSEVNAEDFEGDLIPNGLPSEPIPTARAECPVAIVGGGVATLQQGGNLDEEAQATADLLVLRTGLDYTTLDPILAIIGDVRGDSSFAGFRLRAAVVDSGKLDVSMKAVKAIGLTGIDLNLPGVEGDSNASFSATCPDSELVTDGEIQVGNAGDETGSEKLIASPTTVPCIGLPDVRRTMTVSKTGSGTGTVRGWSSGSVITCGDTCQLTIKEDEAVEFSATSAPGSELAGWTGCHVELKGICIVYGVEDRTITAHFDLVGPVPPDGQLGVTINDGDRYTNDPEVELSMVWPQGTTRATVSNHEDFTLPTEFRIAQKVPWTLDKNGGKDGPRQVYARFDALPVLTVSDGIILDRSPPRLVRAVARRRGGLIRVSLTARDRISGVGRMQLTDHRSPRTFKAVFRKNPVLDTKAGKIFVRIFDRAGNASRWRTLKVR